MVTITTGEAFLFFGAALIGLSMGVAGNGFVTSFFRIADDATSKMGWNRHTINLILFFIGVIMIGLLLAYFYVKFESVRSLP